MSFKNEIKRKIDDFRVLEIPNYFPREGSIHIVKGMVSTLVGARRAGKSYRIRQVADELLKNGFISSVRQICLVDFDNPILSTATPEDLLSIQSAFLQISPEYDITTPLVFILDEIHKIEGWEEYVIDLSRNLNWKVFVTGSSSKLLRNDLSTELRGKSISSIIYPLSFSEFITFHQFNGSCESTKGKAELQRLFDEYLQWGSFPAIPETPEHSRDILLREYFDTMILKDIIQRYNVSKPRHCIQLYNYLLSNIAKPYTIKSAYTFIKQSGNATSRDAIKDYLRWAIDSWLLFSVPVFTDSMKEEERNYRKIYSIDWALATRNSSTWDGGTSRAFENMIYMHLVSKFRRVRYYLTRSNRQEVDFIVTDNHSKPLMAAQACLDLTSETTLKREVKPLVAAAKYFKTKENLILTMDQESKIEEDGVTIWILPAYKWMLS